MRNFNVISFTIALLVITIFPAIVTASNRTPYVSSVLRKAENGDLEAQVNIGFIFQHGVGTKQDLIEAFRWYLKAAKRGHSGAQYRISYFYEKGLGASADTEKSIFWLTRSANQGNEHAMNDLGVRYSYGRGVTKDLIEAYKWFNLSASKEKTSAGVSIRNRKEISRIMTRKQVLTAQRKSREWKPTKEKDPTMIEAPEATNEECRFLTRTLPKLSNWFRFGGLYMTTLNRQLEKKYGVPIASFDPNTRSMVGAKYIRIEIIKDNISSEDSFISLTGPC